MLIEALVLRKKGGPFKLEEVNLDEPRDDEILIQMMATGICHTDIAVRDGSIWKHLPSVLGHEGAGVVAKVGKKIKKVEVGDKVILSFDSCGKCLECKKGHPANCLKFEDLNINWKRVDGSPTIWDKKGNPIGGSFFGQSSFANHALVHERNVVPIDADFEELLYFAPFGCGIQAGSGTILNELKPKSNQTLGIFGAGAVGLGALMAARLLKVKNITVVDLIPSRLKMAKELGAAHVVKKIKDQEFDFIVETTGNTTVIKQALNALKPAGTGSFLAVSKVTPKKVKPKQTIIESSAGDSIPQELIPYLVKAYKKGQFPLDKLIEYYPAADINKAIKDSISGKTIKPVLLW
jgi:aryl-alcohol dehydrogenase